MSEAPADQPSATSAPLPEPLAEQAAVRLRFRLLAIVAVLLALLLWGAWFGRERIADRVIAAQLERLALPGTYRIDRIDPQRQVLRDIVIGNPDHPDLTIAKAEIEITSHWGWPAIGRVTLVEPRLYGWWRAGKVSFGHLDKVLFGNAGTQPLRLPDLELQVIDGRARLLGDHGPVGFAFDGRGGLRGGFAGTLAGIAPRLRWGPCTAVRARVYGKVSIEVERPAFAGPLRIGMLDCGGVQSALLADTGVQITARADQQFDGGEVKLALSAGALAFGQLRAPAARGTIDAAYRKGSLTARYDLTARNPAHAQVAAETLALSGIVRSRSSLARVETEGTLRAVGLHTGVGLGEGLRGLERNAAGTLLAPVLQQIREALDREASGSRLMAEYIVRRGPQGLSVIVPQGRLLGASGDTLLALSRLNYAGGQGSSRLAGSFSTGGRGLPRIAGRLDQSGAAGETRLHITMAEYQTGDVRLALPELVLVRQPGGALVFSGRAKATGPLPGGRAVNLSLPLDGARSAGGGLQLWRGCTRIGFDQLTYGNVMLDRRVLSLCPADGAAILTADGRGMRLAVALPGLNLSGRLGQTPIRIASGPLRYVGPGASPGKLTISGIDIAMGPPTTPTRFRVNDLRARVGHDIAGTFAGLDAQLYSVPLDFLNAAGRWSYANRQLAISDAEFRVEDRAQVDRFMPLTASAAELKLEDNLIKSKILLTEKYSKHEVVRVALEHDLRSGRGLADLSVNGLLFDSALQPGLLITGLRGIIANASGTVRGHGTIAWDGDRITSSGHFGTESLDFAAAFGAVKRLSGDVAFSDLLGLVTPPHQRLKIASINPGIEVTDGEILFRLLPGAKVAVEQGSWPFLGGTLRLRPAEIRFGTAETRRFVLDIESLDAAQFLERMELANMSATGTFDGTLPLVFDENGGRVERGLLVSRPPGGNLSYVGALTYKDLSASANFAFDALRSLDFRTMRIDMDGALEGEIITRVRFDGVKQGAGTKRNLITQRFAKLPLQFNVNLRAPFYGLMGSFKSMYDPAYVKDPRGGCLLSGQGGVASPAAGAARGPVIICPPIQPPVSGNKR